MKFTKWLTRSVLASVFAVVPLTLFVACSNNTELSKRALTNEELQERNQVVVLDINGNPVGNATVLIGDKINSPFPNNVVTTNSDGIIGVPAGWKNELPVTITREGFVKTTYLQQKPSGQVFEIHPRKATVRYEVKGLVNGFGNLPNDGYIDFALAMTSLDPQSALNFDISKLISEESDRISVFGQDLDIPTNVFLPRQKESYGFLPVTIEKAFYRLFYDLQGTYKVQANIGKFDFKKVADKLKAGKSFFEVVNDFSFSSLGTASVDVNQQNVALNFDGAQKKLTPKVDFKLPVPQTGMLFGISMYEEDGKLLPSDIKLREGKSQQLSIPESAQKSSVLLVYADKEKTKSNDTKLSSSMSTALVDSQKLDQGYLLDRVAAPTISEKGIKLSKPTLKGNLKGFATYVALSDVTNERLDDFTYERGDVNWEIYSPGWVDSIDLPDVNNVRSGQRWEVVFYGIDSSENKQFNGPKTLNQATHAVHNSVNF